ncbi:MAG: phage gp6-like head-tail connector protein [Aquabacterium sp.]|nr:phage gp6-like head-tail connector protein [Aquabacterium sp.]
MSLTLSDVKASLRVTHSDDDALLTRLQASATNEAMRLLDDATLTVDALPAVADQSIVLLVQADYDGDPEKRPAYRRAAEQLIYSYRSLGIK